jgi:hypothetical protein
MSNIVTGIISGLAFGTLAAGSMIPLKMEEKRRAMLGAFADRFAIGFVICSSTLPMPGWVGGLMLGGLLSLPAAIITKTWLPIMTIGIAGGAVIGFVAMH